MPALSAGDRLKFESMPISAGPSGWSNYDPAFPVKISEYIEKDLIDKIRHNGPLPEKLTLASVASMYEVSLTPVRTAFENLIESQFILKGANGRLCLNPKKRSKSSAKKNNAPPRLPKEDLDSKIAEDVINLSVQGGPTYLREESAAQRYDVGRTVIRQAFNRLAGSGLIEHVPRRGWQVHPYREQDLLDYIDVRETLELKALSLARKRLEPHRLEEFIIANSPDSDGKPQLDNKLHQYWIELSDNRYIQKFFAQNGIYFTYLFDYSTEAIADLEDKAAEHRSILRSLLKKDWKAANNALSQHIRAQKPNVTRFFERIQDRSPEV